MINDLVQFNKWNIGDIRSPLLAVLHCDDEKGCNDMMDAEINIEKICNETGWNVKMLHYNVPALMQLLPHARFVMTEEQLNQVNADETIKYIALGCISRIHKWLLPKVQECNGDKKKMNAAKIGFKNPLYFDWFNKYLITNILHVHVRNFSNIYHRFIDICIDQFKIKLPEIKNEIGILLYKINSWKGANVMLFLENYIEIGSDIIKALLKKHKKNKQLTEWIYCIMSFYYFIINKLWYIVLKFIELDKQKHCELREIMDLLYFGRKVLLIIITNLPQLMTPYLIRITITLTMSLYRFKSLWPTRQYVLIYV